MNRTDAFRVLASVDRQLVLHELERRTDSVSVDTLSRQVAAHRHRIPLESVTETQADRAHVRLVHLHFPYLLEKEIIAVDSENGDIWLTDDENVDVLFAAARELDQWPPEDLLADRSS